MPLPSLVQYASASGTASTLTYALPGTTTPGNCVIVCTGAQNASANGTVSAVTLGGAAGNFGPVTQVAAAAPGPATSIWADPSCAGTSGTVSLTLAGASGTGSVVSYAMEWANIAPAPLTAVSDKTVTQTGVSTSWNSGTTTATTAAQELAVGVVSGYRSGGIGAMSGSVYPAANWGVLPQQSNPGATMGMLPAWSMLTSPGTTSFYSGTFANAGTFSAATAAFQAVQNPQGVAPSVPALIAGSGYQAGDMGSAWAGPLSFFQQRTVFRALQTLTATTLPSSGAAVNIGYDTILEDPYGGWNPPGTCWVAPFSAFYLVTFTTCVTASAPDNSVLVNYVLGPGEPSGYGLASLAMTANTPGAVQSSRAVYAAAGGSIAPQSSIANSASNVTTALSPPGYQSSVQITWLLGGA